MQSDCSGHRPPSSKGRSITFTVHSREPLPLILQRTTRDSGTSRLWLLTRSSLSYGRGIARRFSATAPHWKARRLHAPTPDSSPPPPFPHIHSLHLPHTPF